MPDSRHRLPFGGKPAEQLGLPATQRGSPFLRAACRLPNVGTEATQLSHESTGGFSGAVRAWGRGSGGTLSVSSQK
jgi:hypothetical protein